MIILSFMRKLAAIVFTDIEGFTKLMQKDEAKAVHMLERQKEIYVQRIKQFNGQVVKYMGDGTLAIFSSAIQAVKCAIALQQAFQKDPCIPVRIGIHQGDVLLENKDVIGDAVNLASRIQTSGIAGSVLISEKIKDELKNHEEISVKHIGSFNLKNISQPVNLFAVNAAGLKIPHFSHAHDQGHQSSLSLKHEKNSSANFFYNRRFMRATFFILPAILLMGWWFNFSNNKNDTELYKTIAILPFENISHDESNNYLAGGLTEEMISLLSANTQLTIKKIPLKVINQANGLSLAGIYSDIKAGSVLEGHVEHIKDSVVIFVNLLTTSTNKIIWANTYRRKFSDLMQVQQEVALQISEALNTNLNTASIQKFIGDRSPNPEAYTLYVQGRFAQSKRTSENMKEAIFFFDQALQIDTGFALAYSGIADNYTLLVDNGIISYDSGFNRARNALEHAFALDSQSAEIRASRALFMSSLQGKRADAINELQLSLKLRPNYAAAHQWYALELAANGQFDSAIKHIDRTIELEPFSERAWLIKSLVLKFARRYKDDITLLNNLNIRFPNNTQFFEQKTECYYWLGKKDSVLHYATYGKDVLHDYEFWQAVCNCNKIKLENRIDELQKAGTPLDNESLATYYTFMGENSKALNCIEDAYNKKEFRWLKYLNVSPVWDALHKEPSFHAVLLKLGFNKL
ncbi:MAG: adenylate/guanylate cyclase domain-containing protein [Parafilimonas sp.]